MITDVGVDLDGVLFDFSRAVVDTFSKVLGPGLPYPSKWEFYEDWGLTAGEFYELLDTLTIDEELFDSYPPIAHTAEGWSDLKSQGVRIHIITHRSMVATTQTMRWLERYRLVPDTIHFTGKKAQVLSAISERRAIAIDDHYEQHLNYQDHGILSFLFDQPWNSRYHEHSRMFTLPEFSQYIRKYNEYWNMVEHYEKGYIL